MAIQRSTLVTKAQELMNTERLDYATAARKARDTMNATTPVAPTTNVIDQMAGKTVAERQAIRSGQPAQVTTAPSPAPVTSSTTPSGATMNADGTVTPTSSIPLTEQQKQDEIKINAQYG